MTTSTDHRKLQTEILELLIDQHDLEEAQRLLRKLKEFLDPEHGGFAIYQNVELGHPGLGLTRYFPVVFFHELDEVPQVLPDFNGGQINWRYHLKHLYLDEYGPIPATIRGDDHRGVAVIDWDA